MCMYSSANGMFGGHEGLFQAKMDVMVFFLSENGI